MNNQPQRKVLYISPDGMYGLEEIPTTWMKPHPKLERPLLQTHVDELRRAGGGHFSQELVKTIRVIEEDGQLYITDGQHEWKLAVEDGIPTLICRVDYKTTHKQQANTFILAAKTASAISDAESVSARRERGDQDLLDIERVLGRYGVYLHGSSSGKRPPFAIKAVSLLFRITTMGGLERLDTIIDLLTDAYGNNPPLEDWVLAGLEYFLWAYEAYPGFNQGRLREVLRHTDQETLRKKRKATGKRLGGKTALAKPVASILRTLYNNNLRILPRLPESRLEEERNGGKRQRRLPPPQTIEEWE